MAGRILVRHARTLQARDFRNDNFIILGATRVNPWYSMFARKLNFALQHDTANQRSPIVNRNPQPGELSAYPDGSDAAPFGSEFAHVALVPNLGGNGKVLLVAGSTMAAKEGAGGFITDSGAARQLADALQVPSLDEVPHFEAVLRVRSVQSTPGEWRIVAVRK